MEKIIYVKYSNDRNDDYKIKTQIVEDEEENRSVIKSSMSEKGKQHIQSIYGHYKVFQQMFEGTRFVINKCSLRQDSIQMEYITGKSLLEILDGYLEKKELEQFVALIKDYADAVRGLYPVKCDNCKSEKFIAVFGNVEIPTGIQVGDYVNIDMIFENIIVNDMWNVIDYEWSFDFQIPVNFIIFRAIYYYLARNSSKKILEELDLYSIVGIAGEEIKVYRKMEENFQNYIINGMHPVRFMHERIGNDTITLQRIERSIEAQEKLRSVQVFIDSGKGYSEEESYIQKAEDENGVNKITINISEHMKAVRIDPCEESCVVKVLSACVVIDGKQIEKKYFSNGINIKDKFLLFETDDPQLIFNIEEESACELQLLFEMQTVNEFFRQKICNDIRGFDEGIKKREEIISNQKQKLGRIQEDYENKKNEYENAKEEYKNVKMECENLRKECELLRSAYAEKDRILEQVLNSRSWKITRIFRWR